MRSPPLGDGFWQTLHEPSTNRSGSRCFSSIRVARAHGHHARPVDGVGMRDQTRHFEHLRISLGASAIKCWWLPRNPLTCYSLSLISRDAVLSAMQAGLTTRCLTFREIFVCTPTSLLHAMAFVGTRRPTDTSIQMPLAAYQHLMAEALPLGAFDRRSLKAAD